MNYNDIVNRVNEGLQRDGVYHDAFGPKPGKPLSEVNAWTYWQGIGVRNPKVVVVGQDWGSLTEGQKYFEAIDEMDLYHNDHNVMYFKYHPEVEQGKGPFETDNNLAKCLTYIGYKDALHQRYDDLFFTNLIPGYRKVAKSTGGFKTAWLTDQAKNDFKDLISVLNPGVIICLGKDTFQQVCLLYGKSGIFQTKSWNDFLESQEEPVEVTDDTGKKLHIFASAHPGYYGMVNRGKKNVYEDWKRINNWMLNKL